ncbi:MAG: hypothetical protein KatS3mg049_0413 [Caldilinea sp.]|nr:MAG: hypothetical protein KatS3mg049_0413 [Caldilinea sp.]
MGMDCQVLRCSVAFSLYGLFTVAQEPLIKR